MKYKLVVALLLFTVSYKTSLSQSKNYSSEVGLASDNDAYLAIGQDRYYTNGIFLFFRHALAQRDPLARVNKRIWEAELGQKMYNPQAGNIPDIVYVDRPFAAYLYGGGSLNWLYKKDRVLRASMQLGVIGPQALGEEAQKLLHNLAGFYEISGWQYQVNNEFEANTSLSYTSLIKRNLKNTADLSFNVAANAGTTFSNAQAGATVRLGKVNRLCNSVLTNSRISNAASDTIPGKELFFYARPTLHLIAYDATVSGGLFLNDKGPVTYDTRSLVFSQQLGFMYAQNRWTLDFSVIFKTREIKSVARAHQYGSLSAFYRF